MLNLRQIYPILISPVNIGRIRRFFCLVLFIGWGSTVSAQPDQSCMNRGIEQYKQRMYAAAIHSMTTCINMNEENGLAHYYRGLSYRNTGDLGMAEEDFKSCIKIDGEFAKGYSGLGQVLIDQKKYKKAIKYLDKSLELDQYDANTYNLRGICNYQLKQYPQAIKFFNEAINYNVALASAYNNRGSARYYNQNIAKAHRNDIELAIQDFSDAIRLRSSFTLAYRNRAMAYSFLEIFDSAYIDINKAIALEPDNHLNYLRKGQIMHDDKKYFESISEYKRAEALNAKDAQIFMGYGNAYIRLNNWKDARTNIEKSIMMDKQLAGTGYYNLARLYALQEDGKTAVSFLKRAKRKGYFKAYRRVAEFQKAEDFKVLKNYKGFRNFSKSL